MHSQLDVGVIPTSRELEDPPEGPALLRTWSSPRYTRAQDEGGTADFHPSPDLFPGGERGFQQSVDLSVPYGPDRPAGQSPAVEGSVVSFRMELA